MVRASGASLALHVPITYALGSPRNTLALLPSRRSCIPPWPGGARFQD